MLAPKVLVLIVGGDPAYVGRTATIRGSLLLNVGSNHHVLGWFLAERFHSKATGHEILWNGKNLFPLTPDRQISSTTHSVPQSALDALSL
jgi:hypothetical protein